MKFYFKPILSVIALAMLLGYAGCKKGGDPEPSITDAQLAKLNSTWKVSNATLDDVAKMDGEEGYAGFELKLSGNPGETSFLYTTSGRPALSPWPSSGTWAFGTNPETDVVRDPGGAKQLPMTYSVSDTQLELTFTYSGAGESGKVTGVWVFTFTK